MSEAAAVADTPREAFRSGVRVDSDDVLGEYTRRRCCGDSIASFCPGGDL